MSGLYVLSDPNTGLLKIGRASNLESRLSSLRTANPDLVVEAWIETDQESKLESVLHTLFTPSRRRGEFFAVDPEVAINKANAVLETLNSIPTDQELDEINQINDLQSHRTATTDEIAYLEELFRVRAAKKELEIEEQLLVGKLKRSIGHHEGLTDFATFKRLSRQAFNQTAFQEDHPDLFQAYQRESYSRPFKARPYLRN